LRLAGGVVAGLSVLLGASSLGFRGGPAAGALPALVAEARAGDAAAEPPAPPARLSDTGLYLADGTVDPRNRPYAPQYPLWTDGAEKSRWIRLPEGARVDASDLDAWRFPPGTIAWKEFAWNGRRVETRMIRAEAGGRWTFATYVWNAEQTDALLAPEGGVPGAFAIADGKRHSIPGRGDCLACHGAAPSRLLGFSALQLSDDRDPLAPHAEAARPGMITLRTLVAEDRLSPPRSELTRRPPRIPASDPVERAARGYLSANCGHCHNARGPLARLGLSLLHEIGPAASSRTTTQDVVGARTRFEVPGAPPESSVAIAPGAPERSAVAYRMASRRPSSQMPPLGTVIADDAAVALVRRWIGHLARGSHAPLAGDPAATAVRPRASEHR
jgi:hypothetical protein